MNEVSLSKFIKILVKLQANKIEIARRMNDLGWFVNFSNDSGTVIRFTVDDDDNITDQSVQSSDLRNIL